VEDENDQVKTSAIESIGEIGKPAVDPLIKLLEETKDVELTIRLVQVLGKIGDKKAVKPLEKIYNESTNSVLKNETAKALNMIP
jgi:HEAT repeat protein